MSSKLSSKKERQQKAKNKAIKIIASALIAISIIIISMFGFQAEELDENGCPQSGIEAKTIVLMDISDPLNDYQKASLSEGSENLLLSLEDTSNDSIERGLGIGKSHQLSVWVMNEKGKAPSLKGQICSPGSRNTESFKDKLSTAKIWRDLSYEEYKETIVGLFPENLDNNNMES